MSDIDKVKLAEKLKRARRRVAELETELMGDKQMKPLSDDVFRSFAESAPDSISIWDSNLNLVYINDATLKYHPAGTQKADVIGKNIKELIPDCEKSGRDEKYSRVLESEEPLILEDFKADTESGNIYLSTKVFKVGGGIGIMATDITERKRMEDALKQSEENLRRVFQSMGDIVVVSDLAGKVIDVNETALRLSGYTKKELIGKDGFKFIAERDRENASQHLGVAIAQGFSDSKEYPIICKDGLELLIDAKATVLHDSSGNPAGLICVLRDISERKRMEDDLRESKERLGALLENAPDIIFSYNLNGRFLYGNRKVKDLLGYDPKKLIGKSIAESGLLSEEGLLKAIAKIDENRRGIVTGPDEYELTAKDGSRIYIDARGVPIVRREQTEVLCIAHDITERKRMEEQLRQSEEKFRIIFGSIADGISVIDLSTGKIIDTNDAALRMFNFAREDIIGHPAYELIAAKDREKAMADLQKTLEKGFSGLNEWRLLDKGRTEHDCEATSAIIRDKSGKPVYLVNVMRDITERKRMEENLRQSEEKLRRIFESIGDAITIIDLNGKIVDANETAIRMSGGKREEHIGRYGLDLLAERDRERAVKDMIEAFSVGYSNAKEYTVVKKDGTEFPAETASTVLRDAAGAPVGIINILRDITERKRIEKELRDYKDNLEVLVKERTADLDRTNEQLRKEIAERELVQRDLRETDELLNAVFENAPDIIYMHDAQGKTLYINKIAEDIIGISRNDIIGHSIFKLGVIPPDGTPFIQNGLKNLLAGEGVGRAEIELTAMSGEKLFLEAISFTTVRKGELTVIGIARNITERKRAEEALREKEALLRSFFNSPGLICGIVELEADDVRFITVNAAFADMYEVTPDAIANKLASEMGTNKDIVRLFIVNYKKSRENDAPSYFEYQRGVGQKKRWLYVTVTFLGFEPDSNKARYAFVSTDISERRKAEEALRESEERYRLLAENVSDVVWVSGMDMRLTYASPSVTRLLGYTVEETLKRTVSEAFTPASLAMATQILSQEITLEQTGQGDPRRSRILELALYRKDGTTVSIEANFSFLRNAAGNPVGILAMVRDISERKQAEAALRESEEKYRGIFDESIATVYVFDTKKNFINTNQAGLDLLGYSREELLHMSIPDVDADPLVVLPAHQELFSGGRLINYEHKLRRKDGTIVSVLNNSRPLTDVHGNIVGMLSTLVDVTERKKAEEALRESEERFKALVENAFEGICVISKEGVVLYESQSNQRFGGLTADEVVGIKFLEIVHPEDINRAMQNMTKLLDKPGERLSATYRIKFPDGSYHHIESAGINMIDTPSIGGIVVNFRDITERKQMEEALQASEEKFRLLAEQSLMAIGLIQDGAFKYVNKAYEEMSGYSGQELLSWKPYEYVKVIHPDDREFVAAQTKRKQAGEKDVVPHYEFRGITKSGDALWLDLYSKTVTYAGKPADLFTFVNITERKQIEQDLRESEERLRLFFENVPDILFAHNMEGQFTDINKKGLELSGYSRDEIVGKNILETGILPPDQIEGVIAGIKGIEEGKSGYPYEVQLAKKNGDRITVDAVSFPVRRKRRLEVMGIAHDITGRKAAEEALRASQDKLRAIFETIGDGIAVTDLEGKLIDLNEADIRLFGYKSREQLLNHNALKFVAEADRPRVVRDMSDVITAGIGKIDQYRLMDKDGNGFDAEVSGSLLRDSRGKPTAIVNIIRDITERKSMEEALKESETKYRTLVEQSEQGICILQNGRIVFANKALSKMNGYSIKEMYATPPNELLLTVHPDDRESYSKRIKERMEGKKLRPKFEYRTIRKDGAEIWLETYSKNINYKGQPAIQSTIVDITDRKQWENKLQESKEALSFYLSQINQAQEEERKRIARELHDDTIQEIVALSRQLDNLIDKKIGPEEERRENRLLIEEAQRKVDTILKGIRRFTRDLRPSMLDDLGLVPALEWLTTDISQQFNIPIKISIRGKEQRASSDVALAMYRISQESLRNACRHSGATHIQVDLIYINKTVTLRITDNGKGFDPPKDTTSLIRLGKLGVAGMYERAQLIGANLSIQSKRNKGTSVTLEVNIK